MMNDNTWYLIRKQSLSVAARNAGSDLAIYDQYSPATGIELKKRAIRAIMQEIRFAFDDAALEELEKLTQGFYVISVSKPLTIQYPKEI